MFEKILDKAEGYDGKLHQMLLNKSSTLSTYNTTVSSLGQESDLIKM